MKKNHILFLLLLLTGSRLMGQEKPSYCLSLDSCRALAIRNNKELQMAGIRQRVAYYEHKVSSTKFLPRVSVAGAYMHTGKEISLLSDGQKDQLNNLGTALSTAVPALDPLAGSLNGIGSSLTDALRTDTRDMGTATVLLMQPVYMGGKIMAYNRITRYAEQIAAQQHDLELQKVIMEVDEAYWQIVSLQTRKQLAESYAKLVKKLDSDVQQMIAEGVATKADGLSVKVKVNEAQVALIQVTNGLSLSQMLLCQLCGLDMDTDILPADNGDSLATEAYHPSTDYVKTAFARRPELNALALSTDIYKEKIRLARAEFLPAVTLTGGWLGSNPSVFNSFERKFKGTWSVGIAVNCPIITCGERSYKIKAARAEAMLAGYNLEETREKVELQVSQSVQKVEEAQERLHTADCSRAEADENLRYATLGMQEGVITISNVLEAQTAWLSAHTKYVKAQVDLRLADLYLRKATGTLAP